MNQQLPLGLKLRASARFENFVAGDNQELVDQLQQLARGEGERFFLCHGAEGLGKTHLLQAVCHLAASRGSSAGYLSLNDAVALTPHVLEGWEQFDLVSLDDVHVIAGRSNWEEALFHLYNRIRDREGCLVVSTRQAPPQCGFELQDLVSRLGWGLTYQVTPLDDSQRLQALQLRARQRGCEIPDETGRFLMRRMPRDMPVLFDMLDRLDEASLVAQRRLTVPFVKSVLGL